MKTNDYEDNTMKFFLLDCLIKYSKDFRGKEPYEISLAQLFNFVEDFMNRYELSEEKKKKPEWKEISVPPELDSFFKRLAEIKNEVKISAEKHIVPEAKRLAEKIYIQLHALYKTQEEHEKSNSNIIPNDES